MRKTSYKVSEKASMSLVSMVRRRARHLRPTVAARAAGFRGEDPQQMHQQDLVELLLETPEPTRLLNALPTLQADEQVEPLGGEIVSAQVNLETVSNLLKMPEVSRLQTKKVSVPHPG